MESIDIEINTDQVMRQLNVMYYDVSGMVNRVTIKKWLNDLEKNVNKVCPDFIVLQNCCRYILFELHRKEWCKYYFLTSQYEANKPITKSHMILSRYPLSKNENVNGTHVIQVKIPFNDVPMRYEYEDLDVQQIDISGITFVVTSNTQSDDDDDDPILHKILQTEMSKQNPTTIMVFGLKTKLDEGWATISDGISFQSQGWKNVSYADDLLQFEMINYD